MSRQPKLTLASWIDDYRKFKNEYLSVEGNFSNKTAVPNSIGDKGWKNSWKSFLAIWNARVLAKRLDVRIGPHHDFVDYLILFQKVIFWNSTTFIPHNAGAKKLELKTDKC